jgi:transposase
MPARRLTVRKIREILRLLWDCGLSQRQVASCCGISKTAVAECTARASAGGLTREIVATLSDLALEQRLYPTVESASQRPEVDWSDVHRQLKTKGVTMHLLWEEYQEREPHAYGYSRYCELYQGWRKRLDVTMRQVHRAGEKLFVDYSGQTVPVVDRETGGTWQAQVFVAVWGASSYTYAEATRTQSLPDWIGAHVRAFEFSGGVPEMVVPDNTRTAVQKACRYEPELNATYLDLAAHYGTAVIPARVRKPRDKAKVEVGVQVVERWILARLRNHVFFSLGDLNREIRALLERLNSRPFRKLPGCRRTAFETIDQPALKPLPVDRFVYGEWKKARVNIDYHIEIDRHYYSVPYDLVGQELDVRLGAQTVECFVKGRRVASHARSRIVGKPTTVTEHMPRAHRDYAEWTPERLQRWAQQSGASAAAVVTAMLGSYPHPHMAFRACLGVIRLGERHGRERLEAACQRALTIGSPSYRSVRSILDRKLENQTDEQAPESPPQPPRVHENLRGAAYYDDREGQPC